MADTLDIEVVYALPQEQELLRLCVPQGTTLDGAVRLSGLLGKHPEISRDEIRFGIFGKLAQADAVLRDRDRVEIYRPLLADPKEVRRRRAAEGKNMKKGAVIFDAGL